MYREQIKPAFISFIVFTVVTGVFYPLFVTGIAQVFFRHEANGSLIVRDGKTLGSEIIGQTFDDPKYFWSRPSATSPSFNAAASSGSNYGPMNPDFLKAVEGRVKKLKEADPENNAAIPVDLVTASGSGLDPHVSLAAAYYQAPRIARIRGMSKEAIKELIMRNTEDRFLGIIGEPVVNVLKINLDLDFPERRLPVEPEPDYFPRKWGVTATNRS